jgi:hypothetical protein
MKVTLVIADNPLRGRPGQNDVTITVSGDPDLPDSPAGHRMALASAAYCAAVSMLAHLHGETAEMTFMKMPWGSAQ